MHFKHLVVLVLTHFYVLVLLLVLKLVFKT